MPGRDTVAAIAEEIGLALEPVAIAASSVDQFTAFMELLGWDTDSYIASVQSLGALAGSLGDLVADGVDGSNSTQALSLVVNFFSAVSGLASSSGLPATIDPGEFHSDFPGQLTDFLIATYLLQHQPTLGASLLAAGVITKTEKPAAGKRLAYERLEVAWNSIGNLFSDPLATLHGAYGWGGASFAAQAFLDNIAQLGDALGLDVFPQPVSAALKAFLTQGAVATSDIHNYTIRWHLLGNLLSEADLSAGLDFYALPATASAAPGIGILPYVQGIGSTGVDLTDNLSLSFKASFTFEGGVFIGIRPNQPVVLQTGILTATPGTAAAFSATLQYSGTGDKTVLLGTEDASRFEFGSVAITTGVRADAKGASYYIEAALKDGALVIAPGADADGFLATLLASDLRADANLTVGFDSRLGTYFGSGGLEIELPAHASIGPLEIISASIALKPAGSKLPVSLGTTVKGSLGPLEAVVDDVGLTIDLNFVKSGGNIGPVAAALAFKPPKGIGLNIDAGVVSGGGFLYIDTERHEYAGTLQLKIADFLSVGAIGLISTGTPSGFSLLIILTADFGPGIQLGFGFTLLAVGGLIGLNRTVLLQPLMDGVRTGAVESIMFPRDIVANAPRIISDLRAIFPPQNGTFLIGPMAKLGWGEPTLVSLSLGVVIEIPPGNAVILGILKVALPAEDVAILVLQVNFAGVLELDKQRFYFFASLFDSHLLFITIQGDMGLLFAYGDDANFVLSVGGFHPQFQPPALPFPSPQRISIDIINESFAKIHADGYFAVTTNTVQFGTHSSYFFGFSACSVQGSSGFDALIQFSPFHFVVDINTQFSVKVFGVGVYGVGINLELSGPTPWHAHGTASLSFFFFSIDIGIDFTWGDDPNTTLPPVAVMPIVVGELQKRSNWRTELGSQANLLVTLRKLDPSEADFILHPAGTLQVSQRAIPLDLLIDKVGSQKPSDANDFSLTVASPALRKLRNIPEQFAPSQFQDADDATKLSEPAFVPQDGGIELAGSSNFASSTAITRQVRYDVKVVDSEHEPRRFRFRAFGGGLFREFLRANSTSQSALSASMHAKTHPNEGAVQVSTELFAIAYQTNNKVFHADAAAFASQASARTYMSKLIATDPGLEGQLHILPHFEVAA